MKLIILKARLLFYLAIFISRLGLEKIKKARGLFLSIFFLFALISLALFFLIKSRLLNQEIKNIVSFKPENQDYYTQKIMTENEIKNEIIFWEAVIQKQPNSIDALLNLHSLNKSLGDNEIAQEFWQKAKDLDPNNKLFNK
ncbi:hypothetical protein KA111_02435 [Candidatus Woesebacteria bacterium]|nr:hypothetical protein [Candidatus Woesebacteria bacterium]